MATGTKLKRKRYIRRKRSVRKSIYGTAERPRLSVFRTSKHIYVQVVNDSEGRTLASSSTMDKELRGQVKFGGNVEAAKLVGGDIAAKLSSAGVETVVFDRNGFHYSGRLQALADAAREKGLKF